MPRFYELGVLLGVVLAMLSGCTTTGTDSPSSFYERSLEEPAIDNMLLTGDSLELSVEADGSMEVGMYRTKVDARGIATFPLVGEIKVGGMRLEEVRKVIALKYGEYYVNPPVIMFSEVDESEVSEWGQVRVLGRVNQPGLVPLMSSRGINLSAAIQGAGGFSGSAKASDIQVSRMSKDGKKVRVRVNFDEIGQLGNADADLKLIDGDIVYVPERIF
ncbi:polysaccharide biosynthesis/export family protein [Pontiella sulfatireligans]|uniref:Uncharacterized protein n=1 Tax=Pontiella sulfatireligans TaxID=2750658 RepID=A0A6C2UN41_9BACT|nr:polysaccharide biosynthesis/export family protein [Pontiella sulfatireligans]VGO21685.1 hypothetical protein SCARR_03759 [Pontiella sulfatireligans]